MTVLAYGVPALFVVFAWWFSTGAVLYAVGHARSRSRWSMVAATGALIAALLTLWQTSTQADPVAAYVAFFAALVVWGWHELSFLTGFITGPRTTDCPVYRNGRAGLWPAIETLIYHEGAILITVIGLYAMLAGSPNTVGLWTFVILWLMRVSAKLNVYLGVPNLTEEFLPEHLVYLKTYFCRRPMNLLFPVSVTASTLVTIMLAAEAGAVESTAFDLTAYTLLATLLGLAVIEHWFLVVPLPSAALWSWGLASHPEPNGGSAMTPASSGRNGTSTDRAVPVSATIF